MVTTTSSDCLTRIVIPVKLVVLEGLDGQGAGPVNDDDRSRAHSVTVERAGSRLHAWVHGPDGAPLIALTHGATMDHRMFDPQIPALTDAGYRVLTWDVRGHGISKPLGRTPITIGDMAEDLFALLEHIGVDEPICVGGQSLGGIVAQEMVLRRPGVFSAVVIIGSTCTTMPIPRWEQWALHTSTLWFVPWPWGFLQRTFARSTARTRNVQEYAVDAIGQLSKREFLHVWGAVTRAIRPRPNYLIEVPLLFTHGEHDRTGNVARTMPAWAARDPHSRYEVIPDASHNANQDNPARFNQVLLEFLTEHYPAGSTA
ncbi:alpha/beta fold hydrolase [Brachybacterium epidermidis]|uniref:alpha/beta fold hydrolase n=1 Tax=Brachybacterium epidermidis TaxID=2781983 RepID=UPI0032B8090E